MSSFRVEVEGIDILIERIKQLDNDKNKQRGIQAVLRQSLRSTLVAAQSKVPVNKRKASSSLNRYRRQEGGKRLTSVMPGRLKRSLGIMTARTKNNPTVFVGARVKGAFRNYDKSGFYAAWVHEGHSFYGGLNGKKEYKASVRKRDRNGGYYLSKAQKNNASRRTHTSPSKPFLTEAYNQTQGKVTEDTQQQVAKFIQRRINKLSK